MPEQSEGLQAQSHPDFELKQNISQASVLQLINESQQVLQGLLDNSEVFQMLALYYPKTYQSILALVTAFESLSVMLQELNVLHDVEEAPEESEEEKEPADKKKVSRGPKTKVDTKNKRHKPTVGEEKQVSIGGRLYRRRFEADGKWHYVSSQHRQVINQADLKKPDFGPQR